MRITGETDNKYSKYILYPLSIVAWLVIWQLASVTIDNDIFLPGPGKVFTVLFKDLLPSAAFRKSVLSSLLHIGSGFLIGSVTGITLAVLSGFSLIIKAFLWFPIKVLKSVPVASFVILSLLWIDSKNLSILISAIIVLPTLYINVLTGIAETDHKLIQMADVFKISAFKRLIHIYIPQILPYVLSAASLAIGMAWKSGVAAEVIGLARNSIGNELYKAKLYLMTPELFAWTIVIVTLSILCETAFKATAKCTCHK